MWDIIVQNLPIIHWIFTFLQKFVPTLEANGGDLCWRRDSNPHARSGQQILLTTLIFISQTLILLQPHNSASKFLKLLINVVFVVVWTRSSPYSRVIVHIRKTLNYVLPQVLLCVLHHSVRQSFTLFIILLRVSSLVISYSPLLQVSPVQSLHTVSGTVGFTTLILKHRHIDATLTLARYQHT